MFGWIVSSEHFVWYGVLRSGLDCQIQLSGRNPNSEALLNRRSELCDGEAGLNGATRPVVDSAQGTIVTLDTSSGKLHFVQG